MARYLPWNCHSHGLQQPVCSAALELAQLTADTGQDYESAITGYKAKIEASKVLEAEIEQEKAHLTDIKEKTTKEKEQATNELNSITKATTTAQDNFAKQKKQLKAELDEYLAQNKLDWQKVSTAVALLNTGLSGAGLTQGVIDELSKEIAAIGSLLTITKQLEQKRDGLQLEVDQLVEEKNNYTYNVNQLKAMNQSLFNSLTEKGSEDIKLDAEIQSRSVELKELNQTMSFMLDDMYVAHLITTFLFNPNLLSNHDLDRLVGLMVGLRQKRLGVGPKQVKDASGNIICECQIPGIHYKIELDSVDIDRVREQLAFYLMPLVKDKFVSRWDYETAELRHSIDKTEAILRERSMMGM